MKNKKYVIPGAAAIIMVAYFILLRGIFANSIFNSDSAGLLLEARDIIGGNFFLDGWHMTGVPFITTDLFAHGLGVIFAGATPEGSALGATFAAFFLTCSCLLFIFKKDDPVKGRLLSLLFFMGFFAFPCEFLMDNVRYHSTGIAEALLGYYLINRAVRETGKKKIIFTVIAVLLWSASAMSDADTILAVTGPVALVSFWNLIHIYFRKDPQDDRGGSFENTFLLMASVSSIALGSVWDKLYFAMGTADKNTYMESKGFVQASEFHDKAVLLIQVLLKLFNADFQDKPLMNAGSFFFCIRTGIILLGFFFIIFNIVKWLGPGKYDRDSAVICLGIFFPALVFIITSISVDVWSARYISFYPAFFGVLIIRGIRQINFEFKASRVAKYLLYGIMALCAVFMISSIKSGHVNDLDHQRSELEGVKELDRVLEENGLDQGYGPFWYASSTTLFSHERVHVRAICESANRLDRYTWFSKDEWYEVPADYVVVEKDGLTYDRVAAVMGEPAKVLDVNDSLKVMVYDEDISRYFDYKLDEGHLMPWEWYRSQGCVYHDESITLNPGAYVWGPYFELKKGIYKAHVNTDMPGSIVIDTYSNRLDTTFTQRTVSDEDGSIIFELPQDIKDFELRVYNSGDEEVTLTGAQIEPQ